MYNIFVFWNDLWFLASFQEFFKVLHYLWKRDFQYCEGQKESKEQRKKIFHDSFKTLQCKPINFRYTILCNDKLKTLFWEFKKKANIYWISKFEGSIDFDLVIDNSCSVILKYRNHISLLNLLYRFSTKILSLNKQ